MHAGIVHHIAFTELHAEEQGEQAVGAAAEEQEMEDGAGGEEGQVLVPMELALGGGRVPEAIMLLPTAATQHIMARINIRDDEMPA